MRGYKRHNEASALTRIMNSCDASTPSWFVESVAYGLECCRHDYNPANETQAWNDKYFIDDRYRTSLWGGIKEAWLYLYVFNVATITPCLSRDEQATAGLDYYREGISGQVKSGCVIRERGSIEFDRSWLNTTADELVVFLKGRPLVLVGSLRDWKTVVDASMAHDLAIDPDHYKRKSKKVDIEQSTYAPILTTIELSQHLAEE